MRDACDEQTCDEWFHNVQECSRKCVCKGNDEEDVGITIFDYEMLEDQE